MSHQDNRAIAQLTAENERLRAELAGQSGSEERFRRITEAAPDMIYCMSLPDGQYEYVNPVAERIFGYTAEEFIENPLLIRSAIHPDWHDYFAKEWSKLLADQAPPTYEYQIVHKNGDTRWLNQRNVVMHDDEGNPRAIWGIVTDVTQAKRDQEILQANKREIEIRNQIAQAFLTIPDDELYAKVLDIVLEALQSEHGVFGYIDEAGALIVPTMTRHIWDQCQVDDKDVVFPRDQWGDSIWPRALRQKEILFSNERSQLTPKGHIPVDRNIAAPIISQGEVIGLLQVGNKETSYNAGDLKLMQTICEAIAPVLHRRLQKEREETRRRQAETELLRERDFSSALLDALPGVFYVLDTEGRFHRWNENFLKVSGYTHDEFGRMSALELFVGADKENIAERIGRVFEDGEAFAEADITTKDGNKIPYYFTGVRIIMEGEPRLIGMGVDITAQRRADEELATIFKMSTDMICIADINKGVFLKVNPAFSKILGYDEAEVVGAEFLSFNHPDDIEPTNKVVEEQLKRGKTVFNFENRYRCKDGSYKWLEWVSAPDAERGLTFAIARDVTERKRHETVLRDLNERLVRSNQELEQFAYVASHDLQEPLRMVSSYTQMLARRYGDKLDQDAKDFIGFAVDGANRMQRLIQDLLAYSRVSTRGRALKPCDAHGALGDARAGLQALLTETNAIVSNDDLPVVLADPGQLTRLFQNLISNAVKFRQEGVEPRIHVSARQEGDRWTISVEDNGIGMEAEYFERIFTIFQRLHAKRDYPGTGIGLSICKRIAERHGGDIWVESEPGKGSTFHFTMSPAAKEPTP